MFSPSSSAPSPSFSFCSAQTRKVTDAEVQKVHKSALLIDTHNDITSRTVDGYDIGAAKNDGHTNVTALKEGGVGAQFFAVYVSGSYVNGNHSARRTLEMIDTVRHDIIARYPNDLCSPPRPTTSSASTSKARSPR